MFVDVEISQVHELVVEVVWACVLVLLGAKSGDALVRNKCLHLSLGLASNYHVNAKVKLEAVDEVWIVNVSLHDDLLVLLTMEVLDLFEELDIVAHRPVECFGDVYGTFPRDLLIIEELLRILWENEGPRYEVKGFRVKVLSDLNDLMEYVLLADAAEGVRIFVYNLVLPRPFIKPRLAIANHDVRSGTRRYLPFLAIITNNHPVHIAEI